MNASFVQRLFLKHTKNVLLIASNLLTPKVGKGKNLTKLLNDKHKKNIMIIEVLIRCVIYVLMNLLVCNC